MEYDVQFADGSVVWVPWSKDIYDSLPYEHYCRSVPHLYQLIFILQIAATRLRELSHTPITLVRPGDIVFVNLRFYNELWYSQLGLPDCYHVQYLVPFQYTAWSKNNNQLKIRATCHLFQDNYTNLNNVFVTLWGSRLAFQASPTCVLVDENFANLYPQILPDHLRPVVNAPVPRTRGRPRKN